MKKLSIILSFLLIPLFAFADIDTFEGVATEDLLSIEGQVIGGGVSCSSSSSYIHLGGNADQIGGLTLGGPAMGQSFAITGSAINLADLEIDMGQFTDAEFTMRISSSADLTTYTEELTGSYTGSGDQVVQFVSSSNPELAVGTWYYGIRVTSGTDADGWLKGDNTNPYAGGQFYYATGDSWNMSNTNAGDDLGLRVSQCD